MKLQDFNFRVWNKHLNNYVTYSTGDYFFTPKNDNDLEIELYTGFKDKSGNKIYEGDIIAHCVDGGGVEYHSKIQFNHKRGMFEFVCIEHPATDDISSLPNPNIEVIGNIRQNPELL